MNFIEDNRRVSCAFNISHKMTIQRYTWHLARCPDRIARINEGRPIYVCKNNRMHIFLNAKSHAAHEMTCDAGNQSATKLTPEEKPDKFSGIPLADFLEKENIPKNLVGQKRLREQVTSEVLQMTEFMPEFGQ